MKQSKLLEKLLSLGALTKNLIEAMKSLDKRNKILAKITKINQTRVDNLESIADRQLAILKASETRLSNLERRSPHGTPKT